MLLSLKDKNLYIGSSSNLKQRLTDHFHGNSQSTKGRRPFKLIFCEYFVSKKDALRREKYFKTAAGKKSLSLVIRDGLREVKTLDNSIELSKTDKND